MIRIPDFPPSFLQYVRRPDQASGRNMGTPNYNFFLNENFYRINCTYGKKNALSSNNVDKMFMLLAYPVVCINCTHNNDSLF